MQNDSEFRASTDQLLELIDRLSGIERAKQDVPVGTEKFIELARQAEELSRLVFRWAGMQLQMAERTPEAVRRGEMSGRRLTSVEPRPVDRILANWREATLRLEIAKPGSDEAVRAVNDIERLREEYQEAWRRNHSRPRAESVEM